MCLEMRLWDGIQEPDAWTMRCIQVGTGETSWLEDFVKGSLGGLIVPGWHGDWIRRVLLVTHADLGVLDGETRGRSKVPKHRAAATRCLLPR